METATPYVTTGPAVPQEVEAAPAFPPSPEELQAILRQQAAFVAGARSTLAGQKAEWDKTKRAFEEQHAERLQALDAAKADVAVQEKLFRELAVAVFLATGDKHPGPGATVKEMTRVAYDPEAALTWAKDRKLFLQLDAKGFESFAVKHTREVPFVRVTKEPEASIDKDLSKALEVQ